MSERARPCCVGRRVNPGQLLQHAFYLPLPGAVRVVIGAEAEAGEKGAEQLAKGARIALAAEGAYAARELARPRALLGVGGVGADARWRKEREDGAALRV